jgi:trans-AT polyketide synthase, acyltransferase and oxidoreductase domains
MQPAADEFASFLTGFSFKAPQIPVMSNVTARPYRLDEDPACVSQLLVKQIVSSVRWSDSIRYLVGRGGGDAVFREVGPGEVLTRLVKQITAS